MDALLATVEAGALAEQEAAVISRSGLRQREVRPYDFKRPERVGKEQMRALEAIHEGFARDLGASLSGLLRTIIEVRLATTEQLTYSEFVLSLPNPTCFNVLKAPPLDGQMCLEISPLIIYPIIDRLLGGANADLFIPQRPLTGIEWRLAGRITDRILAGLTGAWSRLADCRFELTATESNPHLPQIVAPNEVVVVIGFEIKTGPRAGTMSLCVPFNVIEPVMGKLATQGWLAHQRPAVDGNQMERVSSTLRTAKVELRALLATAQITLRELMNLQPGDVVKTEKLCTQDVLIQVEGRSKLWGSVGQFRGRRAVRIRRPVSPDDNPPPDVQ